MKRRAFLTGLLGAAGAPLAVRAKPEAAEAVQPPIIGPAGNLADPHWMKHSVAIAGEPLTRGDAVTIEKGVAMKTGTLLRHYKPKDALDYLEPQYPAVVCIDYNGNPLPVGKIRVVGGPDAGIYSKYGPDSPTV